MFDIKCGYCGNYYKGTLLNCPYCPPPTSDNIHTNKPDSDDAPQQQPSSVVPTIPESTTKKGGNFGIGSAIILIAGIFYLLSMFTNNGTVRKSTSTQTPINISIKSADIPKKDGMYDKARNNDIEELCKDWFYYRRMIVRAVNDGEDEKKINDLRRSFNKVNKWLSEYNESDVQTAMSRIEKESPFK